jgi:hypothetical protein
MKGTILRLTVAMLLAVPLAAQAGPGKWKEDPVEGIDRSMKGADLTCNAGDATSLLAGVAVFGLLARTKR